MLPLFSILKMDAARFFEVNNDLQIQISEEIELNNHRHKDLKAQMGVNT
jgi:hypothetical protein